MGKKEYKQKDMSGVMFLNKFKKPGESSPDFRGTFSMAGEIWDIAAWEKTAGSGETYMSLAITVPREKKSKEEEKQAREPRQKPRGDRQRVPPEDANSGGFEDDDIPF
jgi:hypothetical protein